MAVTQYIGSRYVPVFAEPSEWNSTRTYEPLTIVTHEGNSYTSKQSVPSGIDISNESYWAPTGNYNAQVEAYRREVGQYSGRIRDNADSIDRLAKSNGKRLALNRIGRLVINDTKYYNEGYKYIQAGCFVDSYYYVTLINNINEAYILKIGMVSGSVEDSFMVTNAGHMNGACVNGRDIVFLPSFDRNGDRFDVIIFNVDTCSMTRKSITGLPSNRQIFAIGYDDKVNKYYALCGNDTNMYELDDNFAFEREMHVRHATNYNSRINRNGGGVHDGLFYSIHGNETLLACYSLADGKLTKTFNIGEYQGSTFIGELECLNFVDNDTMYLVGGVYYPRTYTAIQFFQASVNNDGMTTDFTDLRTEFTSSYTYHVNQNAHVFNPNGGRNFPFTYIAEALIAARANKNNVTEITVDGVSDTLREYIYILKSDVVMYLSRANVTSIHSTDSKFYITQATVCDSHDVMVRGNPHDISFASVYIKNSCGVLNDTKLTLQTKPDKYASIYVDELSDVFYMNRAPDHDINDSGDIHVYGTYKSYRYVNQPWTQLAMPHIGNYDVNLGDSVTIRVARSMLVNVSIPGHNANKAALVIMPKMDLPDNCVFLTDGTNPIIVTVGYKFNGNMVTLTYSRVYKLGPNMTRLTNDAPKIRFNTVFSNN